MDNGRVLLGVLAGVAVGATLGVLFAPDSGVNTRKKIVKKGEDYAGSLRGQYDHLMGSLNEEVDEFKDEINKLASQGKAKAKNAKDEVADAIS